MNIKEGILDSLADGGESIIQIREYLNYLKIDVNKCQLVSELITLLNQNKIEIEYPTEFKGCTDFELSKIEDFWFELTKEGRCDWNKIKT